MSRELSKKAQTGIGLLIIFIAGLLIAAVVASVAITSQSGFQEKTAITGKGVTREASSQFIVREIIGIGGEDGTVDAYSQLIKLPAGADPTDLSFVSLVVNLNDETTRLTYRGVGADTSLGNTGYNTYSTEELGEAGNFYQSVGAYTGLGFTALSIDLDLDGATDYIRTCQTGFQCASNSGSDILVRLSTGGDYLIPLTDNTGSPMDIGTKDGDYIDVYMYPIGNYGYITINGDEDTGGYTIPAGITHLYVGPIWLEDDLDDDQQSDAVAVSNTDLYVFLSSRNNGVLAQMNDSTGTTYALSSSLAGGSVALDDTFDIIIDGTDYADITLSGTTSRASYIDADLTFSVTPENEGSGYYSIYYAQKSENYREGMVYVGDSVKLLYELPRPVEGDEDVRLLLVPRSGQTTVTEFIMPNIINSASKIVYP